MEAILGITEELSLYMAAWLWHILAIIFFSFSILFFIIDALPFFIAFLTIFAVCEGVALKRKGELQAARRKNE